MSNRRKLRPSICRAISPEGHLLVKRATYRDPGAYVPSPPHPVSQPPEARRNRAPSGKPLDQYDRFARYAEQTHQSGAARATGLLTPAQMRRWLHKMHAQFAAARKEH